MLLVSSGEGSCQHVGFVVSVIYNVVVCTTPTLVSASIEMLVSLLSYVTKHKPFAAYGEMHALHYSLRVKRRRW
jgi:hypothetical protein